MAYYIPVCLTYSPPLVIILLCLCLPFWADHLEVGPALVDEPSLLACGSFITVSHWSLRGRAHTLAITKPSYGLSDDVNGLGPLMV
jgi:hypothetical protein